MLFAKLLVLHWMFFDWKNPPPFFCLFSEGKKITKPQGVKASAEVAKQGGAIAGNTRKQIEKETGTYICTSERGSNILDTNEEEK